MAKLLIEPDITERILTERRSEDEAKQVDYVTLKGQ
jgi:hypothetical protein